MHKRIASLLQAGCVIALRSRMIGLAAWPPGAKAMVTSSYSGAVAGNAENWLEAVIRMPALVQYYNVGKLPVDAPVVVANLTDMNAGQVDVAVDGHPVEVVTSADRPDCMVEVVKAEQQGSSLRVDFRLPTIGVRGFVVLARDGDKWRPIERSVAKR